MKNLMILSIGVLIAFLSGCNTLDVTYDSNPLGATFYNDSGLERTAPFTVKYPVSFEDVENGIIRKPSFTAKWRSGATTTHNTDTFDLNRFGHNQIITYNRPADAPGFQEDLLLGLQLQQIRIQAELQSLRDGARFSDGIGMYNMGKALQHQMLSH